MSDLQYSNCPHGKGEEASDAPDHVGPRLPQGKPEGGGSSGSTAFSTNAGSGEGKKQAFLDLLMPHYPKALAYSQTISGSLMDGEDLVSDAVLQSFSRFDQLKDHGKFKPWFFAILLNRFKNLRKRNLLRPLTLVADPSGHPLYSWEATTHSDDPAELGYQLTLVKELLWRIHPREREVLLLIGPGEFTLDEAAATLRVSRRAVIQLIHRARKKLAKLAPESAFPFLERVNAEVRSNGN